MDEQRHDTEGRNRDTTPCMHLFIVAALLAASTYAVQQRALGHAAEQSHVLRLAEDQRAVAERIGRVALLAVVAPSLAERRQRLEQTTHLLEAWRWMQDAVVTRAEQRGLLDADRTTSDLLAAVAADAVRTEQSVRALEATILVWNGRLDPDRLLPHTRAIDQAIGTFRRDMGRVARLVEQRGAAAVVRVQWIALALCLLAALAIGLAAGRCRDAAGRSVAGDGHAPLARRLARLQLDERLAAGSIDAHGVHEVLTAALRVLCETCGYSSGRVRYAGNDPDGPLDFRLVGRESPAAETCRGAVVIPVADADRTIATLTLASDDPVHPADVALLRDAGVRIAALVRRVRAERPVARPVSVPRPVPR
jgi:hypothetical protein